MKSTNKNIFSGWQSEAEHPEGKLYGNSCASIDGGVLTIGGYNGDYKKTVYLFKNEKWALVGELKNVILISLQVLLF